MKLSSRLIIIFLLLSLVPLLVVGTIGYQNGLRTIQQNTIDRLGSTNILKADQVNRWILTNKSYIRSLAQRPLVREYAELLCSDLPAAQLSEIRYKTIHDHFVPAAQEGFGFIELSIIDNRDGRIVVSTEPHIEGKFRESETYFARGKLGTYVDDVIYSLSLERLVMHISTPIKDARNKPIAVLDGHVNWREMSAIMMQGANFSNTQESYVVNKFNNFVTESRFATDYPLKKSIHTMGVEACLQGQEGIDLYDDYRGISVLGAYRWMPQWGLCVLTEKDQVEAFAPARTFRNVVLGVSILVAVLVTLLSIFFARSITKRLGLLVNGANEIGGGNLDYRIAGGSSDEIGVLAEAFNSMGRARQMAERQIRKSRDDLEDRVRERTAEIAAANENLKQEIIERKRAKLGLQQSLSEKEVLLREIHHRVKNNMQLVQSLLNLQADKIQDLSLKTALLDSNSRIKSMALIHETLYQSEDLAKLDLKSYFSELVHHIIRLYRLRKTKSIETSLNIAPLDFDLDTSIACGLIVNELVTNACKYAFNENHSGRIDILLRSGADGWVELIVKDNGSGLPPGMDFEATQTLGLRIVLMLAQDQLGGQFKAQEKKGAEFVIRFPLQTTE